MTARYEERTFGVFDRLNSLAVTPNTAEWGEYQRYMAETGEQPDPLPPPPIPTLEVARAERLALVENLAGEIRRRITGRASPSEMASWTIKAQQAQAYLVSGKSTDAPLLAAEAAARRTTLDAIVARVANNSKLFLQAESAIAGTAGMHKDTIAGLATVDEILAYDIEADWPSFE